MTPPIRKGDGTGIQSIRKGDGTEIAEVRKGDGTVIWQAGTAIPDSVVLQYYGNTWTQGETTWADGATADGGQEMSLTGDLQATTLSDGSESVSGDGVDDYGLTTLPPELEGNSLTAFSIEFTMQTATADLDISPFGIFNSSDSQFFVCELNKNAGFNTEDGNIIVQMRDLDGNILEFDGGVNNLTDGARHDVSIIFNDASANDVGVIVDGNNQTLSFDEAQNPSNFGSWDVDIATWARNNGGTIERYCPVDFGAIRWHDSAITSQTISDYP